MKRFLSILVVMFSSMALLLANGNNDGMPERNHEGYRNDERGRNDVMGKRPLFFSRP